MRIIALLSLGRLIVWFIQINGLTRRLFDLHPLLEELRDCDLCLGFWVFSPLAFVLGVNILEPIYVPVLSEALTGMAVTFATHLAVLGWQTKFGMVNLYDNSE
jgi:hypothetical protein